MSIFSKVPIHKPKRNLFNLSHDNKFSCKLGQLIPIMCEPVVPGDTFKVSSELMVRMAPMLAPVMQQLDVYVHHFYVPARLLFDDSKEWEKFISPHATVQNPNPAETTPPCMDVRDSDSVNGGSNIPSVLFEAGELLDFLGYQKAFYKSPAQVGSDTADPLYCSILPINAYNLIYANYYMDQNLGQSPEDFVILGKSGIHNFYDDRDYLAGYGQDIMDYFRLRQRAWKKDYFTSALPFTQRGQDVHLPLYGDAPIVSVNGNSVIDGSTAVQYVGTPIDGLSSGSGVGAVSADGIGSVISAGTGNISLRGSSYVMSDDVAKALEVDLQNVNAATINEFRRANALQKFLEVSARVGSRYKEFVLGHFGVNVPDGRLQRPEYLGGGVCNIQISEVLQTSSTVRSGDNASPLADMAGHGIGYGKTNSYKHTFPEHGYVMSIMSIIPKAAYFQGIKRDLLKLDRLDFFQPEFANIGEQPIYNVELYALGDFAKGVFGYTPRYAEYKFIPSQIHGKFKTSELDYWHMARKFGSVPTLSKEFIEVDEYRDGLNRIFAVEGSESDQVEHFYVYCYNKVKALRPMPYFGVPLL